MAHSPGFSLLRRLLATAAYAHKRGLSAAEAPAAFVAAVHSRREVLAGAAKLAAAGTVIAALPASGCAPPAARIAVVGAGIAGLHCAYRLKEAGFDVTIYEAQGRVGGRMWTGRGVFPEGQIFEIGGELIDTNHATMWALADELGIEILDRWSFETAGMERETYYLGGAHIPVDVLLAQALPIMAVMEQQVADAETDDAVFELLDNTSLAAWLFDNVPVDTAPELNQTLRAAFVGEFGLEAEEQSCLNLLYLFGWEHEDEFLIFGDSDERWHTADGNDTFTTALAATFEPQQIVLGARLVWAGGGAEDEPITLTFIRSDGPFAVEVDHVVLALPFSTLRRVDLSALALSDGKRNVINNLGYGTHAKVMAGFSRRPWWDDHAQSGLLTTDLSPQQGWDSTIGQEGTGGIWTNFLGGAQGEASRWGTPEEWVEGILPDLDTIWPGTAEAYTGTAARMHWPSFEHSRGSYTCYRPGQWAFWSTEGVREGNVHFAGEHCSIDFQGWMEGGAETGGLVAAEILDDYAVVESQAMAIALTGKRDVPQACFQGHREVRLRWMARSRRLMARRPGVGPKR